MVDNHGPHHTIFCLRDPIIATLVKFCCIKKIFPDQIHFSFSFFSFIFLKILYLFYLHASSWQQKWNKNIYPFFLDYCHHSNSKAIICSLTVYKTEEKRNHFLKELQIKIQNLQENVEGREDIIEAKILCLARMKINKIFPRNEKRVAIVNSPSVNIGGTYMLLDHVFLKYMPRSGITASYANSSFQFFVDPPYSSPQCLNQFTALRQ